MCFHLHFVCFFYFRFLVYYFPWSSFLWRSFIYRNFGKLHIALSVSMDDGRVRWSADILINVKLIKEDLCLNFLHHLFMKLLYSLTLFVIELLLILIEPTFLLHPPLLLINCHIIFLPFKLFWARHWFGNPQYSISKCVDRRATFTKYQEILALVIKFFNFFKLIALVWTLVKSAAPPHVSVLAWNSDLMQQPNSSTTDD